MQQLTYTVTIIKKPDQISMQVNKGSDTNHGQQGYKGRKCDCCHFNGHTRENCYKLIGYPNDWKQRKTNNYKNGGSRGYNHKGYGKSRGYGN